MNKINQKMKANSIAFVILLGFMLFPALALAGEWQGTIQGLRCATEAKVCPVDMEDPLVGLEKSFVLVTKDGSWYLLPNLDRAILARHVIQRVFVEGEKSPKYKAITVQSLKVWKDNKWKEVWSVEMEKKLIRDFGWRYPHEIM